MTPFCFMVMPFGRKRTQAEPGKGPEEVDFNSLWDKALFPLLAELGYRPIRADQETGTLIINQMFERLYFSDLVLVDLSVPNGNVYYEMGVRQAMKEKDCILLAADWSKQLFDVAQMRVLRYPLPQAVVDDAMACDICDQLRPRIAPMRSARSPVFELLRGYPGEVDDASATGVREQIDALGAFNADMRTLRSLPVSLRRGEVAAMLKRYGSSIRIPTIALGLLRLIVSCVREKEHWNEVLIYIDGLQAELAKEPFVREQRALALGKLSRPTEAISELTQLINHDGATSEREGLLGGRYKELMRAAIVSGQMDDATQYRNIAIQHYERGMMLDLNDFFPSSNLPRLYRARDRKGDLFRAETALYVTSAACERALARATENPWVRPTLVGVAFDLSNADKAEELVERIETEGIDQWQNETTLLDLAESLTRVSDVQKKSRLTEVLERLKSMAER
jgi:tetratricopeptide (TPR) repeat protein